MERILEIAKWALIGVVGISGLYLVCKGIENAGNAMKSLPNEGPVPDFGFLGGLMIISGLYLIHGAGWGWNRHINKGLGERLGYWPFETPLGIGIVIGMHVGIGYGILLLVQLIGDSLMGSLTFNLLFSVLVRLGILLLFEWFLNKILIEFESVFFESGFTKPPFEGVERV